MRNKLMVTAAVAALIGCTSFAVAQEAGKAEPGKGAAQSQQHQGAPGGAMQHSQATPGGAPGGAMQHQAPSGSAQSQTAPSQEHSAQGRPQGEEHNNASTAQGSPGNEMNGKSSHENAQSQERNRTQENAQSQERNRTHENAQTEERNRTHENAQTEERNRTHENAQTEERNRTQENAQTQSHPGATGSSHENTAEGKGAAGGRNVQISEQQRTRIKDIIVRDHSAPRVAHADFSVRVGVTVPRTVHVAVLPPEIIEIVPEYRGFDYVVVGDELLIIDPHTLEIVYILPA